MGTERIAHMRHLCGLDRECLIDNDEQQVISGVIYTTQNPRVIVWG